MGDNKRCVEGQGSPRGKGEGGGCVDAEHLQVYAIQPCHPACRDTMLHANVNEGPGGGAGGWRQM